MDDKLKKLLNKLAAFVLSVCVIGMIVCVFFCLRYTAPQTHRIVLTASPDSVYNDKRFSYYTDSLINVINKHEHSLTDKYEAILEDKADAQKYWSIGSVLLSVIFGVAGFFGFKTIKDIEHDCQETAKKIAAETATSVATATSKTETKEYLQRHLRKEVKNASNVYLGNQETHITEMVRNAVARGLTEVSDKFDDLNGRIDEISERIDVLEDIDNTENKPSSTESSDNYPAESAEKPTETNARPASPSTSSEMDLFE